ncbi:LysB family phage lysis regulatory protein [Hafnia paralvei]|nr:LysB family phage lysis regulatory protein [Hafnia paralvei]RDA71356.1 LysB family phage lysis regulatory protein [Hafnia paralvei]RDA72474.1 LysB family phage lysis regulatory protein [Hafnia paralvei]RDA80562.1 LysB family phage lysis regulatory protein [Hafnia paralvei]RDA80947.1 LysB family phage lysis regulatory protein [Hafnia paralvei]
MKTLIILLMVAVVGLWWLTRENRELGQALSDATQTIGTQKNNLSTLNNQLNMVRDNANRSERAQVELRQQLSHAQQLANGKDQKITRLLNENKTLRDWYQSALPDGIARLHTRPAFDTPDAYLRWLSEGDELLDTGKPAENQRRSE